MTMSSTGLSYLGMMAKDMKMMMSMIGCKIEVFKEITICFATMKDIFMMKKLKSTKAMMIIMIVLKMILSRIKIYLMLHLVEITIINRSKILMTVPS